RKLVSQEGCAKRFEVHARGISQLAGDAGGTRGRALKSYIEEVPRKKVEAVRRASYQDPVVAVICARAALFTDVDSGAHGRVLRVIGGKSDRDVRDRAT
ncbi:unnamed protein product, partial [Scytosiphon promiscuus]